MPTIPSLEELLKSGVHFGHKISKWHPNAKPLIYMGRAGVHIINLEKTQEYLKKAIDFVKEQVANDKVLLFIGTRKHVSKLVREHAEAAGVPYVNGRWLGGTITNFSSINGLVKQLEDIEQKEHDSEYEQKYNKKERLMFSEKKTRLDKLIGGIREMKKIPDLIFILDVREQMTAVREAHKKGIKIVALVDSNIDPSLIDYPIPANDDSVKSVELMASLISQTVNEGRKESEENKAKVVIEKEKEEKKEKE